MAGHLQIVVDLDPDLVYHFDTDPDPDFYLIVVRIRMHIHAPLAQIRKRICGNY